MYGKFQTWFQPFGTPGPHVDLNSEMSQYLRWQVQAAPIFKELEIHNQLFQQPARTKAGAPIRYAQGHNMSFAHMARDFKNPKIFQPGRKKIVVTWDAHNDMANLDAPRTEMAGIEERLERVKDNDELDIVTASNIDEGEWLRLLISHGTLDDGNQPIEIAWVVPKEAFITASKKYRYSYRDYYVEIGRSAQGKILIKPNPDKNPPTGSELDTIELADIRKVTLHILDPDNLDAIAKVIGDAQIYLTADADFAGTVEPNNLHVPTGNQPHYLVNRSPQEEARHAQLIGQIGKFSDRFGNQIKAVDIANSPNYTADEERRKPNAEILETLVGDHLESQPDWVRGEFERIAPPEKKCGRSWGRIVTGVGFGVAPFAGLTVALEFHRRRAVRVRQAEKTAADKKSKRPARSEVRNDEDSLKRLSIESARESSIRFKRRVSRAELPRISVKSETASGDALRHRSEVRGEKYKRTKGGQTQPYQWLGTTMAQGIKNVQHAIERVRPDIMKRYKKLNLLTPYQRMILEDDIYEIQRQEFESWPGMQQALLVDKAPYFEGSHKSALVAAFPDLKLNPLGFYAVGFGPNLSYEETMEAIQFRLRRKIPTIMERYDRRGELTEDELRELKDDIYKINSKHFGVWGLAGVLNKNTVSYFDCKYAKVLMAVFSDLKLNPLGFHLDLENQLEESLRFALSQVFPDMVERYERLDQLENEEAIASLKNEIYDISSDYFRKPPLTSFVQRKAVPALEGNYKKALITAFPKLHLSPYGFKPDWTTRTKASRSIRHRLEREFPLLMKQYQRRKQLSEAEREAVRQEIYKIGKGTAGVGHFKVLGLANALLPRRKKYFNMDPAVALMAVFDDIDLNPLGFGLDLSDEKQALAFLHFILAVKRPSIIHRYEHYEALTAEGKEELRHDITQIMHKHMKSWGLGAISDAHRPFHFKRYFDPLIKLFPKIKFGP